MIDWTYDISEYECCLYQNNKNNSIAIKISSNPEKCKSFILILGTKTNQNKHIEVNNRNLAQLPSKFIISTICFQETSECKENLRWQNAREPNKKSSNMNPFAQKLEIKITEWIHLTLLKIFYYENYTQRTGWSATIKNTFTNVSHTSPVIIHSSSELNLNNHSFAHSHNKLYAKNHTENCIYHNLNLYKLLPSSNSIWNHKLSYFIAHWTQKFIPKTIKQIIILYFTNFS